MNVLSRVGSRPDTPEQSSSTGDGNRFISQNTTPFCLNNSNSHINATSYLQAGINCDFNHPLQHQHQISTYLYNAGASNPLQSQSFYNYATAYPTPVAYSNIIFHPNFHQNLSRNSSDMETTLAFGKYQNPNSLFPHNHSTSNFQFNAQSFNSSTESSHSSLKSTKHQTTNSLQDDSSNSTTTSTCEPNHDSSGSKRPIYANGITVKQVKDLRRLCRKTANRVKYEGRSIQIRQISSILSMSTQARPELCSKTLSMASWIQHHRKNRASWTDEFPLDMNIVNELIYLDKIFKDRSSQASENNDVCCQKVGDVETSSTSAIPSIENTPQTMSHVYHNSNISSEGSSTFLHPPQSFHVNCYGGFVNNIHNNSHLQNMSLVHNTQNQQNYPISSCSCATRGEPNNIIYANRSSLVDSCKCSEVSHPSFPQRFNGMPVHNMGIAQNYVDQTIPYTITSSVNGHVSSNLSSNTTAVSVAESVLKMSEKGNSIQRDNIDHFEKGINKGISSNHADDQNLQNAECSQKDHFIIKMDKFDSRTEAYENQVREYLKNRDQYWMENPTPMNTNSTRIPTVRKVADLKFGVGENPMDPVPRYDEYKLF